MSRKQTPFRLSTLATVMTLMGSSVFSYAQSSYTIVDTNQTQCSNAEDVMANCAAQGEAGFGQDAQYQGHQPSYTVNGNGTVTDNNTGLVWAQTTDLNGDGQITAADKVTYEQGAAYAAGLTLGGYDDWRVPTIKELYSLMLFDGEDPSGLNGKGSYSVRPFIDHTVFGFDSGDTDAGERLIDSQYLSSTKYVSTTMKGDETVFGVNFIDGRIKGYGMSSPRGGDKTFFFLAVRGNIDYGINQFVDNGNQTITDSATGLTWQQGDSEQGMNWFAALEYCENLTLGGSSEWRLPNVKELHSIVDYSKSPDTSNSASIDSAFDVISIVNEGEQIDYPNYWSSTTHQNMSNTKNAAYVSFGRSMGYMQNQWLDVHGAGAQRSDPKVYQGKDFPEGHGPQGDSIRYNNYVRCVSGGDVEFVENPTVIERESKVYELDGTETSIEQAPNAKGQTGNSKANNQEMRPSKPQPGGERHTPLQDLDTNGDNKISYSEARGPLKQDFERLDRNGDGYLSGDELQPPPRR